MKSKLSLRALQPRANGAPGKPHCVGSAFTGRIERLLPETAWLLVETYFRLLYLPLREPRGPRCRAAWLSLEWSELTIGSDFDRALPL